MSANLNQLENPGNSSPFVYMYTEELNFSKYFFITDTKKKAYYIMKISTENNKIDCQFQMNRL